MQGNSVRLRLNRKDVERFVQTGRCEETVEMAGGEFRYALESDAAAATAHAEFDAPILTVRIPSEQARAWATDDGTVGIEADQQVETGAVLKLAVEKDFQCLHKGEAAKDPDAYPNPMAV